MEKLIVWINILLLILFSEEVLANGFSQGGDTNVSEKLQDSALQAIKISMSHQGCASILRLDKKIIKEEPLTGMKGHVWSKEGWMVFGCKRSFPYYVLLVENGDGGSYVQVK
ncbi:hypothetical protein HBA55_17860 [Pseudomaricurvus alkylphenolicus]|uniref:hypothetical protein n=1 Tax=Pseudomaricurvus alkylphenolicus TaxID=1306991 RepID=UPI001420B498|nr:hypothetical protein [Pseudomaricurvus alkylphenolicus]NIB41473.1 hypothetical protein [Pseudomaricurvus alkylphenolicus]